MRWPWKYKGKGPSYSVLQEGGPLTEDMGFKSALQRVDRFISVPHGPIESKTQLFLTK